MESKMTQDILPVNISLRRKDDHLVVPTGGSVEGVVDRMALQAYTEQLTRQGFLRRLRRTKKADRAQVMAERLPTVDEVFIEIFSHLAKSWIAQHPELELTYFDDGTPHINEGAQLRVQERISKRLLELKYPNNS